MLFRQVTGFGTLGGMAKRKKVTSTAKPKNKSTPQARQARKTPAQVETPLDFRPSLFVIGRSNPAYLPNKPEDIQAAFAAADLFPPYVRFLKRQPNEKMGHGLEIEQWTEVDDNASDWNQIAFTRGQVSAGLSFLEAPVDVGTGVGQVEQWITLSRYVRGHATLCKKNQEFHGLGLLYGRGPNEGELAVARSSSGITLVAAAPLKDMSPDFSHYKTVTATVLSAAGAMCIAWAELHLRLRKMLDAMKMPDRLGMTACAQFLLDRTHPLVWHEPEEEVLERVARELILAAPCWKQPSASPAATDAPEKPFKWTAETYPLGPIHEQVLRFMKEQQGRVLLITEIADRGPVSDRKTISQICNELAAVQLLWRPPGRKQGFAYSPLADRRILPP